MSTTRRWLASAAVALLLALSVANAFDPVLAQTGEPLYPDLQTATPGSPSLQRTRMEDGLYHYLLRFDNVVENHGGRLEIVADPAPNRVLYQNVYDAREGGNLVVHQQIATDLVYHPTHNHFHLKDFASYVLVKKNSKGVYRRTSRTGAKTSVCILDSVRISDTATTNPSYSNCNAQRQGLSSGWGDLYAADFPEQWIDLGTSVPSDGDYAIQSIADPLNRITETDEYNNMGVVFFSVRGGKVEGEAPRPFCATKPATAPVGAEVVVVCDRLSPGETYDLRWRYATTAPMTSAVADAEGKLWASFVMPPSTRGLHYVYLTSRASEKYILAPVDTLPTFAVSPLSGGVGTRVDLRLTGFGANEQVTVVYTAARGALRTMATLTTDNLGNATGRGTVSSSILGPHRIEATAAPSGIKLAVDFIVAPTLKISPATAAPGAELSPTLRGFGSSESIRITLQPSGRLLRTAKSTSFGSVDPSSSTRFKLPSTLPPGDYQIVATGLTSGGTASARITVASVAPAEVATSVPIPTEVPPPPTAAPSPTPAPTETPTPEPTATPPPEPTPAPTEVPPPPEPTVVPSPPVETAAEA